MLPSSAMGMFDTVRCRYPLPHHQDATFQTKDLARIVEGDAWLSGFLDEYQIMKDGRLRRRRHKRVWVKDKKSFLGGYFKSVRSWWQQLADVHGDIRIYTSDGKFNEPGFRWVEFRIRFTNGRVQDVRPIKVREKSGTPKNAPRRKRARSQDSGT
jgi:hypothetical protein